VAQKQAGATALSGAGMTGKGHHLTGGDIEADAFQDIAADGLLTETDIIKIY
jgi:hypothetical protein